jgi:hypothetical protein
MQTGTTRSKPNPTERWVVDVKILRKKKMVKVKYVDGSVERFRYRGCIGDLDAALLKLAWLHGIESSFVKDEFERLFGVEVIDA